MKTEKIIYWTTTGLVSAGMLMSAGMYLTGNEELLKGFQSLGLPLYFVGLLGMAKLLGAVALILPMWRTITEWSYAGFAFVFIGAIYIHVVTQTPWVAPLMFLILLGVSYFFRRKLDTKTQEQKHDELRTKAVVQ